MEITRILYLLFVLFYVFFLPGYLIAKRCIRKIQPSEVAALSFGLSMLIMPILCFAAAILFRTYVSKTLVLLASSLVNIIFIKTFVIEVTKHSWRRFYRLVNKENMLVVFVVIVVFSVYLMNFKGPATNYWDTYITSPAMFITNSRIDFVDIEGKRIYEYELEGKVPENLVNRGAYGIITKDQRLGAGIFFSLPFLFFNIFGFRLFYALTGVMTALFGFLIGKKVFRSVGLGVVSSLLIALNPYIISVNNLNANLLGLMIVSIIIFLLLRKEINWIIIGVLYGILGGVRNVALLFLPALLLWLYFGKGTRRHLALFVIGALIAISPVLFWNQFAFGSMFMHPTQYSGLEGYRPTFEHRFLFWKFEFNGLLNYPLYDKIVRTPHFAFPNYLTIPLVLIRSFGLILFALLFFGISWLWNENRKLAIFLLLFSIPFCLFLVVQENWEELKTTFVLLLFNPIIIFMVAGIKWLFREGFTLKLFKIVGVSLILMFLVKAAYNLEIQEDERWYQRFPHAVNSESGLEVLGEEYRDGWQFFYTCETEEEYLFQKRKLTEGNPLPELYEKFELTVPDTNDIYRKDLETLEIWNYIYS